MMQRLNWKYFTKMGSLTIGTTPLILKLWHLFKTTFSQIEFSIVIKRINELSKLFTKFNSHVRTVKTNKIQYELRRIVPYYSSFILTYQLWQELCFARRIVANEFHIVAEQYNADMNLEQVSKMYWTFLTLCHQHTSSQLQYLLLKHKGYLNRYPHIIAPWIVHKSSYMRRLLFSSPAARECPQSLGKFNPNLFTEIGRNSTSHYIWGRVKWICF